MYDIIFNFTVGFKCSILNLLQLCWLVTQYYDDSHPQIWFKSYLLFFYFYFQLCVFYNVFCTSFHFLPNAFNYKFPNIHTLKFVGKVSSKVEAFSVMYTLNACFNLRLSVYVLFWKTLFIFWPYVLMIIASFTILFIYITC